MAEKKVSTQDPTLFQQMSKSSKMPEWSAFEVPRNDNVQQAFNKLVLLELASLRLRICVVFP